MSDIIIRIVASLSCATFFCVATFSSLGAMQQSGYKNGTFWRWLRRSDNLFFNRLCTLALCLALASTATSLCFSFLGVRGALAVSAVPFFILLLGFCISGEKYALKVPTKRTGRLQRLFAVYFLFVACATYIFLAALWFLAKWNGSQLYGFIAYTPFAVTPMLLPLLLCLANGIEGIFENARNKKFVKRAGQVLDESKILRVGVVGSYGKTSVKNILKTVLLEKYSVVETPESYNTPIGVAKTVFSDEFTGKAVLIAEMGARRRGDIAELCRLVKPDYAIFTGVCPQHISSFGSVENVWTEKKEIIKSGAYTVCGVSARAWAEKDAEVNAAQNVAYIDTARVENVRMQATKTSFSLRLDSGVINVETSLLGDAAVENILLAATLAEKMGMTAAEIENGIKKLSPIPHRLQLIENNGVYILDDGYNGNPRGAEEALAALSRFEGRKCIVTPGLVECGVLEERLNGELGEKIAAIAPNKTILVGETLVGAVRAGYANGGGNEENLVVVPTLQKAQEVLAEWVREGDCVLFLNDLPDVY
ncbi:MAG: UDP-N-acetylmuramoyl-tripeptide--D-alanyl-D-alanine ligase [Clostridia bacterium]|nr:UDP-N-acetylmuramoyl-tripeptide--D-alanyl-D-alanine ligase [Clostridia bacterium]